MFNFNADLSKIDYAVVYFNKAKTRTYSRTNYNYLKILLNILVLHWGSDNNEIIISRLRIKSAEDSIVYV